MIFPSPRMLSNNLKIYVNSACFSLWCRKLLFCLLILVLVGVSHSQGETQAEGGLRRIFGPKWGENTGELRRLQNKELHDLYSSPIVIRDIKSSRMSWKGHVQILGRGQVRTGFWWGNVTERDHFDLRQLDILYMSLYVSGSKTRAIEAKRSYHEDCKYQWISAQNQTNFSTY